MSEYFRETTKYHLQEKVPSGWMTILYSEDLEEVRAVKANPNDHEFKWGPHKGGELRIVKQLIVRTLVE